MNISFPQPPTNFSAPLTRYLLQIFDAINRGFGQVPSGREAVPKIILLSPNGTAYDVTVSNTGVVTTTLNPGTIPGAMPPPKV